MHEIAYPIITPDDAFKSDPDLTGLGSDLKRLGEALSAGMMNVMSLIRNNLHYILPAILLNPVLFLHGLNAMFTATMSSLDIPNLVSSFVEPHVDINNNHKHAFVYTLFITYAQWRASQKYLNVASQQTATKVEQPGTEDEDDYYQANGTSTL